MAPRREAPAPRLGERGGRGGGYDDFEEVSRICKEHNLWMHIDGKKISSKFNKNLENSLFRLLGWSSHFF